MNGFLYILGGKAAVGSDRGEKDQIEAHNTVTLTKVCPAVVSPRTAEACFERTKYHMSDCVPNV